MRREKQPRYLGCYNPCKFRLYGKRKTVCALVGAGAGVLRELAFAALRQIDVELFGHGFPAGCRLNLHDRRKAIAGGEGDIRYQGVAGLGEGKVGRRGAIAGGDRYHLLGRGDGFAVLAEECDFHLAVAHDEKLGARVGSGQNPAAVWTCYLLLFVLGLEASHDQAEDNSDEEGEGDGFYFHVKVFLTDDGA